MDSYKFSINRPFNTYTTYNSGASTTLVAACFGFTPRRSIPQLSNSIVLASDSAISSLVAYVSSR